MKKINIHSKRHNYKVIIHDNIFPLLDKFIKNDKKYFILIDKNVLPFFKEYFAEDLRDSVILSIPGGEKAKTIDTYQRVISAMEKEHISRDQEMIVIGGGTIGDLGAFVASTYKRGIGYYQIPTTTLSMIDSCIGGKTAINFDNIKNLVGTFYPPKSVLVGLDVLNSLDERNYKNGLYEAIKMGLIMDRKLFNYFESGNYQEHMFDIISRSIKDKARVVSFDEFDKKGRRKLNYGHTIGHAIELNSKLLHGEAVANGMLITSRAKPYYSVLKKCILNLNCPIIDKFNTEKIIEAVKNDKKIDCGYIQFVEVDKVGKAKIVPTTIEEVKGLLDSYVI